MREAPLSANYAFCHLTLKAPHDQWLGVRGTMSLKFELRVELELISAYERT
jgi:hypothetical protein